MKRISRYFWKHAPHIGVVLLLAACEQPSEVRRHTELILDGAEPASPSGQAAPLVPGSYDGSTDEAEDAFAPDPKSKEDMFEALYAQMPDDDIHAVFRASSMDGGMSSAVQDPLLKKALESSIGKAPLSWETPGQWNELPGGGMRLATFTSRDPAHPMECSVISLVGGGGTLADNVKRWALQLGQTMSDPESEAFITKQQVFPSVGGQSVTVFDFTSLQDLADSRQPSMMVSILELPSEHVFIKMTGPKSSILAHRDAFHQLIKSLKVES